MTDPLRAAAAVVGVGSTTFGKLAEYSALDLGGWALTEALADAGRTAGDVDGLITCRLPSYEALAAQHGLRPRWLAQFGGEGRMTGVALHQAVAAIATGQASTVAIVYGNDGASTGATYGGAGEGYGTGAALTRPYGLTSPGAFYAMMLARHRHRYGGTEEQLATIPMTFREHARLNPRAVMRKPVSLADYLASRYIVEPMHLFDYCLINDGGVALVLTEADRADDGPKPPVPVLGVAQRAQLVDSDFPPEDFWAGAVRAAGDASFAMAGLTRADVDAAMIYDNFSPNVLFTLEGLGYCAAGEGIDFVQDGRIGLGGELPLNTSGGHLSESYMQGWGLVAEAVRQLRGECGDRQVADAEIVQYACASPVVSSIVFGKDR